jgi:hypothetical protein
MEVIKTYKGFNKDMTCRYFQYEEGKEYVTEKAEACECGFHACEYPLDVFSYYPPGTSVYHEVEQSGDFDKSDSDKVASTKIKIGARIDIAGIVKAAISYIKERITNENNAEQGTAATAGSYGAATAGSYGAATAGDRGAATSKGRSASGENGLSVVRGNGVKVKGGIGAVLVIAEEEEDSSDIKDWLAVVVDGVNVKADTWYELKNGELVECKEE